MKQLIEVFVDPVKGILFTNHGGYESRNESTMTLFQAAYDSIADKKTVRLDHFYINTDDVSFRVNNTVTFGYTASDDVIPCPDFIFDRYVECGIDSYENTVDRLLDKGSKEYSIAKLFWTGNLNTQPLRYHLYNIGKMHKDRMEIIPMDWKREAPRGSRHQYTSYTSLEDQTRYKFLIDCGARGYSGRVKLMLHSNRPLFLVDREKNKQEFFHHLLEPYKHFIPVKDDLSDLVSQLTWAERNYDEAVAIAANAREFAREHLNKPTVVNYLSKALQDLPQ